MILFNHMTLKKNTKKIAFFTIFPYFMQHYNWYNYYVTLLNLHQFYCMALCHSQTQRHVINREY